jgi:predicted kinase
MELVVFIGIQAAGKSTFYKERFYRTHVRLNLDMLKTRRREEALLKACFESRTRFVVDNSNLTRQERARYIAPARRAGFAVAGYFFESRVADALRRNRERAGRERVPDKAVFGASGRLELPSLAEGFDRLFVVRLDEQNGFSVEEREDLSGGGASRAEARLSPETNSALR